MSENARQEVVTQKPRMAICYDFDKTLSPDDMQSFTLIPSLGMRPEDFWPESNQLAKDNLMDNNLAWMYQLVVKSKALRNLSVVVISTKLEGRFLYTMELVHGLNE